MVLKIKNTMKLTLLFLSTFLLFLNLPAQDIRFRNNIDKDSLFNASVQQLPEQIRDEYIQNYQKATPPEKEFLLFMISMPKSSKKELIENYINKKTDILNLKRQYQKYVPKNYIVDIEIKPESKILTVTEKIAIKIYKIKKTKDGKDTEGNESLEIISQNWDLEPGSDELKKILKYLKWTDQTLSEIKILLQKSNCISIENGKETTIGYARSDMGKYSYKIFDHVLTPQQKKEYNNGCQYIFYEDNIVLEYGGGAIGPQCFEKE